ncbi:NADPH:quinone reductase [Amycolatopsis rhabdoformis]|uniref:NADPH:quinone reductase n=1 Tax=Amycolatopsis rhabdoformis TaxID=1448059 RepID=A0ABZ1IEM3_9PSEU|nr:NADPH:quinone reductase [Amycolatopsis rhabdoformis]WSE32541.1 NADPH:quinone reductase [Amycolatopsis rhabdoformis]
MRAAYVEQLGGVDEIRVGELPDPVAGPGEVLVDVVATSANPVDTFVRSGLYVTPVPLPLVLGRDVVGRVVADAAGFRAGEWVWSNSLGHGGRQGAAAERAVVPAERLYRLPEGADPFDVVVMVHPGATAYLALVTHGRVRAGETVLVAGGGGNVGAALIELAAAAGARVIATASADDLDRCRALGATEVFDYRDPGLADRLAAAGAVDVFVDTSGRNDLEAAVGLLAERGRIVVLAGARSRPVLPAGELYMHDRSVLGFAISNARAEELAEAAVSLNDRFAHGGLRPHHVERRTLADAAETHRRLEQGAVRGRVVLVVS